MSGQVAQRAERVRLHRRTLRMEFATIAWNLGEAVFTISLGLALDAARARVNRCRRAIARTMSRRAELVHGIEHLFEVS